MKTDLMLWHILDTVVQQGGVAKAADKLHRSQSAVSYSLKQLEMQTGVSLLTLQGRQLALTEQGELLLNEARLLLQRGRLFDAQVRRMAQGVESSLHLAVEQIVPRSLIWQALRSVQQQYPHVNVQWHEVLLSGVDEALSDREIDVVIAAQLPHNQVGVPWITLSMIAVASPQHPLWSQVPSSPMRLDDLTDFTQAVMRDSGQKSRDIGWLASPRRWTFDSLALMQQAVEEGLAYAWLPEPSVRQALLEGRLLPIPLAEGREQPVQLYVMPNGQKTMARVATCFYHDLIGQTSLV